ncbi:MAG: hypothetical protein HY332_07155 [Chloroflexi bacterium]|nr:hypothetical protein [Chloroflexota bacterium]
MPRNAVAWEIISWLIVLPPLAILLLYFWGYLHHAWSFVRFPHQIDYGEMPELNRAWLLAHGRQIYVDWTHPPYQMTNYTPLYSAVAALGVVLAGPQFFTGRLISFVSALVAGVSIGVAAASLGAGRRGALIAGLLYFAGHPVWHWTGLQRVDSFAVALELLGVAVFAAGWVRARRTWAVWATIPLFLAAVYSRQTVVAGAFACYGYLLSRRPRLALAAIAVFATVGLAILSALQMATAGWFWRHIVDGNVNRWTWERVDLFWQPFWRLLHWAFPLAAGAALLTIARRQAQVPLLYFVASAATALTIGKIGSNVNYLLQLWAVLALLAGLTTGYVEHLAARALRGRWYAAFASSVPALWLLVGLQQAYHVPYTLERGEVHHHGPAWIFDRLRFIRWPLWRLDPWAAQAHALTSDFRQRYRAIPDTSDAEDARRAQEYVARLPGDVLAEDMVFTITTGKRIYLQPFEFTQLAEQGDWDQRPLLEDIQHKRFSAVVLRFRLSDDPSWHRERINQPMIDALTQAYRLDATYGDYFLYRPR